jgi:adenylosuccinate lyase
MISRYSRPDAVEIWSEQRRCALMLEIELLACEAMEAEGEVPAGTAAACRAAAAPLFAGGFPLARIAELEATLKHDVIAFLTAVNEVVGAPGRHLHKGMTSSDVLDTALAVQLKESGALVLSALDRVLDGLEAQARAHAHTPCIGRSHGIHAEPTTFGWKLAYLWDALRRARLRVEAATEEVAVGKVSGAVGTFAHLSPAVEAHVCARLGLRAAPVSTQVVARDAHAAFFGALALLATTIEQVAVEIRHLQRTEVAEVMEAFTPGQKGSSAMPHKRNPILSENLTGLARLVRGYAQAALDDVVLWHERDISHSSVERVIGPDAVVTTHFMLHRLDALLRGLVVFPAAMQANLDRTQGIWYAQRAMLLLVEAGLSREDAYAAVQRHALAAWETQTPLRALLADDPAIAPLLDAAALDAIADPRWFTRRADAILDRTFAGPRSRAAAG